MLSVIVVIEIAGRIGGVIGTDDFSMGLEPSLQYCTKRHNLISLEVQDSNCRKCWLCETIDLSNGMQH